MPSLLTVLLALGAVLLAAISATLSFLFCRALGATPEEGLAYGTAAAVLDIMKALAPFAIAARWRAGQRTAAGAATLLWMTAIVVSLSSAIGLAALGRFGRSGAEEAQQAQFRDLLQQLEQRRAQATAYSSVRPTAEIEADIAGIETTIIRTGQRLRTLAVASADCRTPGPLTEAGCTALARLKAELARAGARDRLESMITALADRIDGLRQAGRGEGTRIDAQAGTIAELIQRLTGLAATLTGAQIGLIVLMALALEIGSSCGLYAALCTHVARRPAPEAVPPAHPRHVGAEQAVERFCAERLVPAAGRDLSAEALYGAFCRWCEEAGEARLGWAAFADTMRTVGGRYGLAPTDTGWRDIGIDAARAEAELAALADRPPA